jgi:succinate dehydrogenase flavin-adding protein (antitoxin of CptAB toxin-antitoxin module)
VPDPDLYAWLTLVEAPPANYSTPVLNALIRFHHSETVPPG